MKDLRPLLDETIHATHAERGFVILHSDKLEFLAARSREGTDLKAHASGVSQSIIQEVLANGEARLAYDSEEEEVSGGGRLSVRMLGLRGLLCAPLTWEGIVLGVLYVDSSEGGFSQDKDLPAMQHYAEKLAKLLK